MCLSIRTIIVACFCTVSVVSCKKNEDESPAAQKLEAGKWKISAGTQSWKSSGADTTIDYYSQWRACEQDDLLLFYRNGDGAHEENTNKCVEDNPSDPFKWNLQDSDTRLHIVIGGKAVVFDILELSDMRLTLRYVENDVKLGPVTYTETHTNIK